jgi:hypothetical protein
MKKLIIGLLLVVLVLVPVACNTTVEVFFPVQKSSDLDQMTADFNGDLELVDGWLRARSVGSDYLLIWPYGFTVRGQGEEIQVLDGDGQVVAIEGEVIRVGGGESTLEVVEAYIGKLLPDDLAGPFWIVSEVISD